MQDLPDHRRGPEPLLSGTVCCCSQMVPFDTFMVFPVVALCIPLQLSVTMCLVERTRAR